MEPMSNPGELEILLQQYGPKPPIATLLNTRIIAFDAKAGTIAVTFEGQEAWTNPHGGLQGGMVAALLDETMGALLTFVLFPARRGLTLELKVSMLRPARPGPLMADGRVVQRTKRVGNDYFIKQPDGRLLVRIRSCGFSPLESLQV